MDEANVLEVNNTTIKNLIVEKISTIGEKLSFRRFEVIEKKDDETFGIYSHMGGKIVSVVVTKGDNKGLAFDIAMQIAAMRPLYLNREDVPTEVLEKERQVQTEIAENEGLDETKIPMIVNGRLNKYYEEVCLIEQNFVKENKVKVGKYVADNNSSIIGFVRYEVGEGLEKREENFADEVKKQIEG